MLYQVLADVVVLIHFAFILFVLLGGLLALRWHWMPWIHLPAVAWGAAVEKFGWLCPLTPIENLLRRTSGSSGYSDGFIEHYLIPIIYPAEITQEFQLFLAFALIALNLAVYLGVWLLKVRSR